jgi:hypothetical protein
MLKGWEGEWLLNDGMMREKRFRGQSIILALGLRLMRPDSALCLSHAMGWYTRRSELMVSALPCYGTGYKEDYALNPA